MLSVFLVGPPELGRLDGLTVTIRDTNPFPSLWKEPVDAGPSDA